MGYLVGFLGAITAAIFFGSNYIPCKQYDMGDGMYFQFVMAVGIWVMGFGYFVGEEPGTGYFHPLALLGGMIWSIGNVLTVSIMKMIGMALGLSIWSGTNLVVGWVLGKYGWLGFKEDDSVCSLRSFSFSFSFSFSLCIRSGQHTVAQLFGRRPPTLFSLHFLFGQTQRRRGQQRGARGRGRGRGQREPLNITARGRAQSAAAKGAIG